MKEVRLETHYKICFLITYHNTKYLTTILKIIIINKLNHYFQKIILYLKVIIKSDFGYIKKLIFQINKIVYIILNKT